MWTYQDRLYLHSPIVLPPRASGRSRKSVQPVRGLLQELFDFLAHRAIDPPRLRRDLAAILEKLILIFQRFRPNDFGVPRVHGCRVRADVPTHGADRISAEHVPAVKSARWIAPQRPFIVYKTQNLSVRVTEPVHRHLPIQEGASDETCPRIATAGLSSIETASSQVFVINDRRSDHE